MEVFAPTCKACTITGQIACPECTPDAIERREILEGQPVFGDGSQSTVEQPIVVERSTLEQHIDSEQQTVEQPIVIPQPKAKFTAKAKLTAKAQPKAKISTDKTIDRAEAEAKAKPQAKAKAKAMIKKPAASTKAKARCRGGGGAEKRRRRRSQMHSVRPCCSSSCRIHGLRASGVCRAATSKGSPRHGHTRARRNHRNQTVHTHRCLCAGDCRRQPRTDASARPCCPLAVIQIDSCRRVHSMSWPTSE